MGLPDHGTTAEVGPFSLVRSVCSRLTMYTLGGSFAEVVCFLEGLFSGEAHAAWPSTPRAMAWGRLVDGLREELVDGTEEGGWQASFIALRRLCVDDREALDRLATRYDGIEAIIEV